MNRPLTDNEAVAKRADGRARNGWDSVDQDFDLVNDLARQWAAALASDGCVMARLRRAGAARISYELG